MRETIERYARGLEGLSLEELSRGAEKLVSRERRHTAALIAHLAEISRRKGHLALGFKSLFDYGLKVLRLSEGAIWSFPGFVSSADTAQPHAGAPKCGRGKGEQ